VQLDLPIDEEVHSALETAASQERRSVAAVLQDAVVQYIRSKYASDGYRQHWDLARRYIDAPKGSDEEALLGHELAVVLAREQGIELSEYGGDARVVRARLRRRRVREAEDAAGAAGA
jgi:hypothetical protein